MRSSLATGSSLATRSAYSSGVRRMKQKLRQVRTSHLDSARLVSFAKVRASAWLQPFSSSSPRIVHILINIK